MRRIRVAATQMSCSWDRTKTLNKADCLVHRADEQGVNIILLQELFETPYFCQRHSYEYMGFIGKLIYRMGFHMRKSFILHRETRDSKYGKQGMLKLV